VLKVVHDRDIVEAQSQRVELGGLRDCTECLELVLMETEHHKIMQSDETVLLDVLDLVFSQAQFTQCL
jgi:hypothetical protein